MLFCCCYQDGDVWQHTKFNPGKTIAGGLMRPVLK